MQFCSWHIPGAVHRPIRHITGPLLPHLGGCSHTIDKGECCVCLGLIDLLAGHFCSCPLLPFRYTKQADWEYISQCARSSPGLQLIGNGDIMSYTDYNEHMRACPELATTMLARGALIKPWLFTEVITRTNFLLL